MKKLSTRRVLLASLLWLMACGADEIDTVPADGSTDAPTTSDGALTQDALDAGPTADGDATGPLNDGSGTPSVWQAGSLGDAGVISALHLVSLTEVYAVGGSRVIRYNGVNWMVWGEPGGQDATLYDVWVHDGTVFVVGSEGLVARREATAMIWTIDETDTTATLRGLFGRSAADIWAVGDGGTIMHHDGVAWSTVHDGSSFDLNAVWGHPLLAGPDGVYAVGNSGRLWSYNGATWETKQIADPQADLQDIWGSGDTLVAVGTAATIAYKASAAALWKGQVSNDNSDRDIHGVFGAGEGDVWLAGAEGLILHQEEDKWNVQTLLGPMFVLKDFVGIAVHHGDESAGGVAVASTGGGLLYDGDDWVDMQTRPDDGLEAIAGSRDDGLWAVGGGGLLMRWHQGGWIGIDSGTTADLHDVAVDDQGRAWVVGDDGSLFSVSSEGAIEVVDLNLPVLPDLYGVALDGEAIAICGKGGLLWRRASADVPFAPANSGTTSDLRDLVWGGDGALWLVGAFGRVLRGEGDLKPETLPSGVSGTLHGIVATDEGALAVGDNGVILELTAEGISFADCDFESTDQCEMPGLPLYGVSRSDGVDFAVGWNGTVLRRGDEGLFVSEPSGTNAVLDTVWHDAVGALAGGRQGAYLERAEAP